MASSFGNTVKESKCDRLVAVVQCGSGKFLCFTRLDRDTLNLSASDGYDLWRLEVDSADWEAHRELNDLTADAYFTKMRIAFQTSDISVAQMGVKCSMSLGHGSKSLDFELFEAKAIEKKTELQNVLFHLAEHSMALEKELEKANNTIATLKQHKGGSSAVFGDYGDGNKKKNQPKIQPKQAGMSVINPGSRKRKAPKGVQFD